MNNPLALSRRSAAPLSCKAREGKRWSERRWRIQNTIAPIALRLFEEGDHKVSRAKRAEQRLDAHGVNGEREDRSAYAELWLLAYSS